MNSTAQPDNQNFSDDRAPKTADLLKEKEKPENSFPPEEKERKLPIPPPSDPKQYRAIGLIEGQYKRSEDQLTKGHLITNEGIIEAVLLGRIISLIKNHLDLEKPHLWVVYPRTRQQDDCLHVQIVGVWEPATLEAGSEDSQPDRNSPATKHGYFSIRGEVIFYSEETETAIVKIKQSGKKDAEKPKFFKIKLKGTFPHRPLNHFWDLQVKLESNILAIAEATDIGLLGPKKSKPVRKKGEFKKGIDRPRKPETSDSPPVIKAKKSEMGKKKSKPSLNNPYLKLLNDLRKKIKRRI